jgi:hypothetical protein
MGLGGETVRTAVAEFGDGEEFLRWLELVEDFEISSEGDKTPLSDSGEDVDD